MTNNQTNQLIRRVHQATRKRCTAEEKIRIVMEGNMHDGERTAASRCYAFGAMDGRMANR